MKFDFTNPLNNLSVLHTKIWDAHVHIWEAGAFEELSKWGSTYGIERFMGIAQPEVKKTLDSLGRDSEIVFGYYLPMQAFAEHDSKTLLDAVDEAHSLGYSMLKCWFGPRFLDYFNATKPFSISNPTFEPVFTKIEDYNLPLDIHVSDPDVWYSKKYLDKKRYRTKKQAISEFVDVLKRVPSLKVISVHFGSLPESLDQLTEILEKFKNLYVDTASTKWIIRELGKDTQKSRAFFIRYQNRILFASDLSCGWGDRTEDYFATRYWTQRVFWETNFKNVDLPFPDDDNSEKTFINGLGLPQSVLENFYWKNAVKFFS
ncbi:MAG: amidohydrolase family protein [Candidatus Hodarchaeales archaeon]